MTTDHQAQTATTDPGLEQLWEEELRRRDRSARESLDLRGEIIANMGEGVCLVTVSNERIVFANPSLERMLGYEPGKLIGRQAYEVMTPDDLTPDEEAEREEARQCLQEQGNCTYEGRRVRRDGTTIWCRTTTTT